MNTIEKLTPYDQLGGEVGLRALVNRFYELMDELPEAFTVRKFHPENLTGAATSLFEYLSGWFGGPELYIAKKGHPRLRMRHAPYAIDSIVRDEWMMCMTQALNEEVADSNFRDEIIDTFAKMANHLVNTNDNHRCIA